MEEKRIIQVSYNKAKEWYNSNNSSLKEIALQAFSEEELEQIDLKELIDLLLNYSYELTATQKVQLESLKNRKDITKVSAPKLLRILAAYFNAGFWKKKEGEEGYFFYKKEGGFMNTYSPKIMDKYWCISSHTSVCYPTLVYFKKEKDCKEAYNIMKSLGKLDALYTDF
jgi:hypothetical protein